MVAELDELIADINTLLTRDDGKYDNFAIRYTFDEGGTLYLVMDRGGLDHYRAKQLIAENISDNPQVCPTSTMPGDDSICHALFMSRVKELLPNLYERHFRHL